MSKEKVDTARRFGEAFERANRAYWTNPRSLVAAMKQGDLESEGEELLSYLHPEVEWKTAFSLTGETARGHLAFLSVCDRWLETCDDYRTKIREIVDLGGDDVLVVTDALFTGKGTGIQVKGVSFAVLTLHDGLIVRIDEHADHKEALEAVASPAPESDSPRS
jgi:hypothetical protein